MKKLISITKTLGLLLALLVTSTIAFAETTKVSAIIDETRHTVTIYVSDGRVFIKENDINALGKINISVSASDGWYTFIAGIDNTNPYSSINQNVPKLPYYIKKDSQKPAGYVDIEIINQTPNNADANQGAVATDNNSNLWLYLTIGILVVVVVVLIIALFVIKKRRNIQPDGDNTSNNVITAVEEVKTDTHKGLQHVFKNKSEFYAVQMNEMFDDTAIKTVYFSRSIIGQLNAFFKDFLGNTERTNETGCYLLGCWDYHENSSQYDISIEYMVRPGRDAVFNEYTLSFGKEIGISSGTMIDDLVEKTKNDYVRTSWMHSHPGLGLFLSSHDLVVQKQLAYSDAPNRLLAIVIDTNTPDWQLAMFSPKMNGVMNNKQELKKTISFDTLYSWSRTRPAIQAPASEYFTLRVNIPGFNTVNFTGRAINQIDDVIYSNKNGIAGYFYGTRRGSDIFIDKCLQYNNVDSIGCFVNDPRTQCDSIPAGLIANVDGCDFVMVCCDANMMSLFVKKDSFYHKCPQCDTLFRDYKEWTRRKRI